MSTKKHPNDSAASTNTPGAIPQDVLDNCTALATQIAEQLAPYVRGLDDEDRHGLYKLGDKSVGYFQKLNGYVDTAPQFVPAFMNVPLFKADASVVIGLQPLYQVMAPLMRKIEDTRMLSGSEAMTEGKSYYGSVSLAAKAGAPGAQAIYNDLSTRFPGRKGNNGDGGTGTVG